MEVFEKGELMKLKSVFKTDLAEVFKSAREKSVHLGLGLRASPRLVIMKTERKG